MKKIIATVSVIVLMLSLVITPADDACVSVYFIWFALVCASALGLEWATKGNA